jgi:hypothetical protein
MNSIPYFREKSKRRTKKAVQCGAMLYYNKKIYISEFAGINTPPRNRAPRPAWATIGQMIKNKKQKRF